MTDRPHDTVITALLDATAAAPVLEAGGKDRAAVECGEAVTSVSWNLARQHYRRLHPGADLTHAVQEGRRLLAVEGTTWLLKKGYLRAVGDKGLALGKSYMIGPEGGKKTRYVPGLQQEEELFHDIRQPIPERLDLLRESMARFGDLREYFPVLLDEDEHLVDGRHRRAIDPEWPAMPKRVPRSDRLAAALAANETNAWTAEDWRHLRRHAQYVQGRKISVAELSRLALLENHKRSNRAIGKLIGASEFTVRKVRDDLESTAIISQWRPSRTPGTAKKKGGAELDARIDQHLEDDTFNREVAEQIAAEFGYKGHTTVEARANERLAQREAAAARPEPPPEEKHAPVDDIRIDDLTPPPVDAFEVAHLILEGTPSECAAQLRRMVSNAWRAKFVEACR